MISFDELIARQSQLNRDMMELALAFEAAGDDNTFLDLRALANGTADTVVRKLEDFRKEHS